MPGLWRAEAAFPAAVHPLCSLRQRGGHHYAVPGLQCVVLPRLPQPVGALRPPASAASLTAGSTSSEAAEAVSGGWMFAFAVASVAVNTWLARVGLSLGLV